MSGDLPLDAYAVARWLGYLALFAVIGACVVRRLAGRALHDRPAVLVRVVEAARALGFASALALVAAALLRLYFQVRSALDPGEPTTLASAALWFDGVTSWGAMWSAQAGAAVVAAGGLWLARRASGPGWGIASAGALVAAVASPLTGHAIENHWGASVGVALQALHLLAGAIWLGTLLVLLVVTLAATRGPGGERERAMAAMVHAYSPLALAGAGTAVVLGLLLGWLDLGSIPALWGTAYGRTLLIKLSLLGGVAALGAHNWRRVRPVLGAAPGAARLARSATAELVLGAALLAVTAVLVALAAPAL